jgi:TetR/AcrR family transcriptional regulator
MAQDRGKPVNPLFVPRKAAAEPAETVAAIPAPEENASRMKLVLTAAKLFSEKGFDGVSTRDIAGAAGVNISLISYYFNGKEGLYMAVLEDFTIVARRRLNELFKSFDRDALTKETYLHHMNLVVRGVVEMKQQTPYVSQLLHRELVSGFPHAKEFVNGMFQTMALTVIEVLMTAQKKGIIRKDIHVATHFMTMIHALDTYFLFTNCGNLAADVTLKLPAQQEQYIRQMQILFVEGVLA